MENKHLLAKTIGKAIFLASLQSSWGAVEMSSKFSVLNFSRDQETLQRAADALRSYIFIGIIWTIGTCLTLFSTSGWCGIWIGLLANAVMMAWIIISYINAFNQAAKQHNLQKPTVFTSADWKWIIASILVLGAGILLLRQYFNFGG